MDKIKKINLDFAIIITILVGLGFILTYITKLGYYKFFAIPKNYLSVNYKDIIFFSGPNLFILICIVISLYYILNPENDFLKRITKKLDKMMVSNESIEKELELISLDLDKFEDSMQSEIPVSKKQVKQTKKKHNTIKRKLLINKIKHYFINIRVKKHKFFSNISLIFSLLIIAGILLFFLKINNLYLFIICIFQTTYCLLTLFHIVKKKYAELIIISVILIPAFFYVSGYYSAANKTSFFKFQKDDMEYLLLDTYDNYIISKQLSNSDDSHIYLIKQDDLIIFEQLK